MDKIKESIKLCLSGDRKLKKIALQAENAKTAPLNPLDSKTRKVYFCAFQNIFVSGSLTLEAAFVIPLFLFFMVVLLSLFEVYRVQALIKTSIHQSAMELGMYAYGSNSDMETTGDVISTVVCQTYTKSHLPDIPEWIDVSVLKSVYTDNYIKLSVGSICCVPFLPVSISMFFVENNSQVRAWTGRDISKEAIEIEEQDVEMVYISEHESVYHTSSKCTHLDLSVDQCKKRFIEYKRNQYGEKYHLCEKCGGSSEITNDINVFYTEKGDCYHIDATCSGIKRTIILIDKSEIFSVDLCERCESRENS